MALPRPVRVDPTVEAEAYRKMYPDEYLLRFLRAGTRPDGRTATKFRPTTVNLGPITTANGSALVRIGGTSVVCGVKAEVAEPRFDAPNQGYIVPNVALSPLCSPRFKPGPPSDEQQSLSDKLNNFVKQARVIDLSILCIEPGKAVWVLYVDVQCLNYDGNVFDATLAAVVSALLDVRLPKAHISEVTEIIEATPERDVILKLQRTIFSVTLVLIEGYAEPSVTRWHLALSGHLLLDPNDTEELIAATSITVACDELGMLCGIWKAGGTPVSMDQMKECIEIARNRHAVWIRLLKEAQSAKSTEVNHSRREA